MPRKMMDEMIYHHCGEHKKWMGAKLIILGLLILANAYWIVMDWGMFIGLIVAIAGFFKLIMPMHYE